MSDTWVVLTQDNADFAAEPRVLGSFATHAEAIAACRERVDACLEELLSPGLSAEALFQHYVLFGEEPYLPGDPFSAWDYARQRARDLAAML